MLPAPLLEPIGTVDFKSSVSFAGLHEAMPSVQTKLSGLTEPALSN